MQASKRLAQLAVDVHRDVGRMHAALAALVDMCAAGGPAEVERALAECLLQPLGLSGVRLYVVAEGGRSAAPASGPRAVAAWNGNRLEKRPSLVAWCATPPSRSTTCAPPRHPLSPHSSLARVEPRMLCRDGSGVACARTGTTQTLAPTGVAYRVGRHGTGISVTDARNERRYSADVDGPARSCLAVPIRSRGGDGALLAILSLRRGGGESPAKAKSKEARNERVFGFSRDDETHARTVAAAAGPFLHLQVAVQARARAQRATVQREEALQKVSR